MAAGLFAVYESIPQHFTRLPILSAASQRHVEPALVASHAQGPAGLFIGEKKLRHVRNQIRMLNHPQVSDDQAPIDPGFANAATQRDEEAFRMPRILDAGQGVHVGTVEDAQVGLVDIRSHGPIEV